MEQFVWQNLPPSLLDDESGYVWTCGCNLKHPFSKSKRHSCTTACYEKKERKSIVSDCTNRCAGWFTGPDKRACKKVCKETGGEEPMDREEFLDELLGGGVDPEYRLDDGTTQAGIGGNMNMIIGIVIGLIVLIGAIIMFKK